MSFRNFLQRLLYNTILFTKIILSEKWCSHCRLTNMFILKMWDTVRKLSWILQSTTTDLGQLWRVNNKVLVPFQVTEVVFEKIVLCWLICVACLGKDKLSEFLAMKILWTISSIINWEVLTNSDYKANHRKKNTMNNLDDSHRKTFSRVDVSLFIFHKKIRLQSWFDITFSMNWNNSYLQRECTFSSSLLLVIMIIIYFSFLANHSTAFSVPRSSQFFGELKLVQIIQ